MDNIKKEKKVRLQSLNKRNKELYCGICGEKATSIIRGKDTCSKCFSILSKDNARLFKENKDIPENFSYLKNCGLYYCTNKFMSIVKYKDKDVLKEYCSEECKKKDEEIQLRNNI